MKISVVSCCVRMKHSNLILLRIACLVSMYCLDNYPKAVAQDSLTVEVLKPLTHSFTLTEHGIAGSGADFLRTEISQAQFTFLGDYGDSRRVAEFTNFLIPKLDALDYKMMILEVGPVSAQVLNQLPSCNKNIAEGLGKLNNKYGFKENNRNHHPMPALRSKEDAAFIASALNQKWTLLGLNNDSWNALGMLLDELFLNLPIAEQDRHRSLYDEVSSRLTQLYSTRKGDLVGFVNSFESDRDMQKFLEISAAHKKNTSILKALDYSLKKCVQYAQKKFYEKNRDRIRYEKELLKDKLTTQGFDLTKDKLLVKMYRRHTAKGFQPDGFYGFGNTLDEIAAYNGNQTLHIGFFKRFSLEDGELKDDMDHDYYVRDRYKDVIQMGQRDQWTIIDLRPLIRGSYYADKYMLSPWIQNLMKQHDLIIIPPTDQPGTPNFDPF